MSKALDPETNDRLRAIAKRLMDERFDGKVTKLAEAMGISHPALLEFLRGTRGAGMTVLRGLQTLTGKTLDELLRSDQRAEEIELPPMNALPDSIATHPDYPPLRTRLLKTYAEPVVEMVDRGLHGMRPTFLTWTLVRDLAELAQKHLQEKEERESAVEQDIPGPAQPSTSSHKNLK